jgi:hypothetical protein
LNIHPEYSTETGKVNKITNTNYAKRRQFPRKRKKEPNKYTQFPEKVLTEQRRHDKVTTVTPRKNLPDDVSASPSGRELMEKEVCIMKKFTALLLALVMVLSLTA